MRFVQLFVNRNKKATLTNLRVEMENFEVRMYNFSVKENPVLSLLLFDFRGVRASHVLISAAGRVCLSGMRSACFLVQQGEWRRCMFEYPQNPQKMLCWLSPEILEQVTVQSI